MDEFQAAWIRVCVWMRCEGPMPTDEDFVRAINYQLADWGVQRANGMDIVASAALDNVKEIIMVLREEL